MYSGYLSVPHATAIASRSVWLYLCCTYVRAIEAYVRALEAYVKALEAYATILPPSSSSDSFCARIVSSPTGDASTISSVCFVGSQYAMTMSD